MLCRTVVIAVKVVSEYDDYDNYTKKVDTELVRKMVDTEFDHECDTKEIGTRYCSKQAMECPFKP